MAQHRDDASVQQEALHALANIGYGHIPNQTKICAAGGVEATLHAMNDHKPSAQVQAHGCRAIRYIVGTRDEQLSMVCEAGGPDAVIAAMRLHAANVEVQEQACWALRDIAAFPGNREHLAELDAAGFVQKAAVTNPASQVQKAAREALRAFSSIDLCGTLGIP